MKPQSEANLKSVNILDRIRSSQDTQAEKTSLSHCTERGCVKDASKTWTSNI